jgi:hypothetical protein
MRLVKNRLEDLVWARRFAWHPILTIDRGWIWLRPYWVRYIGASELNAVAILVANREWMF